MIELGCTTPYGVNQDSICTKGNTSLQALDIYQDLMATESSCLKPCSFTSPTVSIKDLLPEHGQNENDGEHDISKQYLHFKQFIKQTKSRIDYTELELLAEVGGYVGLFMGFSVFHLRNIFVYLIEKICY